MSIKLLFIFFLLSTSTFAAITGTIKGIITDAETNEALPGANIVLEGTSRGTATDLDGKYRITNVPAGESILVVTYIGYQDKRQSVTVMPDEITDLDIQLNFDALEGEVIVVTGQLEGQSQAINRQISANTIVNVVSSDKIQELPDQNAAESVGRLPGISIQRDAGEGQKVIVRGLAPRFNSITVNGVRIPSTDSENRSVDLSMISPDVLAGIEVFKALTPDHDGDALGGTVNFITKKADEGLKSDTRLQYGFNALAEEYGQYRASTKLSNRYFNNTVGVIFTGGLQRANRGSDILSANYFVESEDEQGVANILLGQLNLGDRVEVRNRYNISLGLDYEFGNGSLFFNSLWGRTDRDEIKRQRVYSPDQNQQQRTIREREMHTHLWSNSLSGDHFLLPGALNLDMGWMVSYSKTKQETPYSHEVEFRELSAFSSDIILNRGPEEIPEFAFNRLDETFLKSSVVSEEMNNDEDVTAKLDLKIPFDISENFLGYVKIGGKYIAKSRDRDVQSLNTGSFGTVWRLPGKYPDRWNLDGSGRIIFSNFQDPGFEATDFLNGAYTFGPGLNADQLNDFRKEYRYENFGTEESPNLLYEVDVEALTKSYVAKEKITAAYFMTEINFGKSLMFLPGVRYERTINDYNTVFGKPIRTDDEAALLLSGVIDTSGQGSYEEWLPMIHLRYKATSWFDIRLAVTKTLSRPDYFNLVPWRNFTDNGSTITQGNPNLKPITSWNYDAFFSFYSHLGLFTFGLYKKEVHDVDYIRKRRVREDEDYGNVNSIIQPENVEGITDVYGLEVELQTNLRSLPSPFDGIVLYANYSYISSKTFYPFLAVENGPPPFFRAIFTDTLREAPMIGQADHIANFSIGYEKGGFSGRLSMIYQGAILRNVNLREELDQYDNDFVRWDIAILQQVYKGLSVFLYLNNISDRPESTFLWKEIYPTGQQFFGWTGDLGIRYKF
jgi:TonB-dependent receptor